MELRDLLGAEAGEVVQAGDLLQPGILTLEDLEVLVQPQQGGVVHGPDDAQLLVAVVERGIVHSITGGENAGEVLTHDNVWRAIEVVEDPHEGEISIDLPGDAVRDRCSVIAWVQDGDDLEIVGATQTHLAE